MGKGAKEYRDKHWGVGHLYEVEWSDPDLDAHLERIHRTRSPELVEWGRLVGFHFIPRGKKKEEEIQLTNAAANQSHLVYDPAHRHQRLYILLDPKTRKEMRAEFWTDSPFKTKRLSAWAGKGGGRHQTSDYPNVMAKPVGVLTYIDYACEKKGDGFSYYRHKMGEESGIRPYLVVDSKGRLWVAGGNYTGPSPGITD